MLALAPCTDFMIHVDADAIFANLGLSLEPWVHFMQVGWGFGLIISVLVVQLVVWAEQVRDPVMKFKLIPCAHTPLILLVFLNSFVLCVCAKTKGIDQLFSKDVITESPINYGVFMVWGQLCGIQDGVWGRWLKLSHERRL